MADRDTALLAEEGQDMIDLPDQPEGSSFKVRPCDWGWRIAWRPRPHRSASIWAVYGLLLAAVAFAFSAFCLPLKEHWIIIGIACVWALFFAGLAVALFLRQRTLAHEVLVLGRDEVIHFPAWSPARASVAFMPDIDDWFLLNRIARWREILTARSRTTLTRDQIGEIQLLGKGRFEHVAVTTRSGHCDMGKHLPHADREWLVEVLRRWKDTTA